MNTKRYFAVLTTCFLIIFVNFAIRNGYSVLLPEMLGTLNVSKAEAGIIYSSFFATYTIFSPILGIMGDRLNIRYLLTIFVAILSAGSFLMAFTSSLLYASLFFALAGIGSAACWAPVVALTQRWSSFKNRGKVLAFVDIGSSLSVVAVGTILPAIVLATDWHAGWLSLGSAGFAVAFLSYFIIRNPPENQTKLNTNDLSPRPKVIDVCRSFIGNSRFHLIGMSYLFTGFAIISSLTYIPTYAVQELKMPYSTGAGLVTILGISAIAGKLTLGAISDKLRRIHIIMLCSLLIAGASIGLASSRGWLFTGFTAVLGIGYGTIWAMYAASASDYFPRQYAGSIVGLWTIYVGVGSFLAPITAGWIADATGTLAWSFVMTALSSIISIVLLIPLVKTSTNIVLNSNSNNVLDKKKRDIG